MFEVGKRVIAIKTAQASPPLFKRGDTRLLIGIKMGCCEKLPMLLDLGYKTTVNTQFCSSCGMRMKSNGIEWVGSKSWRPLSDMQTDLSETTVETILELQNV